MKNVNFGSNFKSTNYFLLQVPEEVEKSIDKGEVCLKTSAGSTFLCSNSKTFEVKHVETSNSLYVAKSESNGLNIVKQLDHTLELLPSPINNGFLIDTLKRNELKFNFTTGSTNLDSLIKLNSDNLFCYSNCNREQFERIISNENVINIENNLYYVSPTTICDFIKLFDSLEEPFNLETFSNHIQSKRSFSLNPEFLAFFLEKLTVVKDNQHFYDLDKIKLILAMSTEDEELKADELMDHVKAKLRASLPVPVIERQIEAFVEYSLTDCADNLYPGYKKHDLRFLKGSCFAIVSKGECTL